MKSPMRKIGINLAFACWFVIVASFAFGFAQVNTRSRETAIFTAVDVKTTGQFNASTDIKDMTTCVFVNDLTALAGGASPDVAFIIQGSFDDTTFYTFATEAALAAPGTKIHDGITFVFPRYVRVGWTVTGAPTTATATMSLSCVRRGERE